VSMRKRLEHARCALGRGVTQRRACTLMSVYISGLVYEHKILFKDGPIIKASRDYLAQHSRYGTRSGCGFFAA
jgi:putative transposase